VTNNSTSDPQNQTAVTIYQFDPQTPIRTILDKNGDPWFVALDVCKTLGISNSSNVISRLDDEEKDEVAIADPIGRPQNTTIINESGLYSVILNSRKPEAKKFKKWITSEVLPTIRKTGQYQSRALTPLEQLEQTVMILKDQQAQLTAIESRVQHVEDTIEAADGAPQQMTVAAYARWHNINLSTGELTAMGKRAKRYSDERGYPIKVQAHAVYGKINLYHIDALRYVFSQRSYFEG